MLQASFYPVLNQFSLIPHLTQPARPHAPSPYDHLFRIQYVQLGYESRKFKLDVVLRQ